MPSGRHGPRAGEGGVRAAGRAWAGTRQRDRTGAVRKQLGWRPRWATKHRLFVSKPLG